MFKISVVDRAEYTFTDILLPCDVGKDYASSNSLSRGCNLGKNVNLILRL